MLIIKAVIKVTTMSTVSGTSVRGGFTVVLSSDHAENPKITHDFVVRFRRGLDLRNSRYQCAMTHATIWFSFYNVSSDYNNTRLRYYNGTAWNEITIPDGNYTARALIAAILNIVKTLGDDPDSIVIRPNYSTGKFEYELSGGYKLDFTGYNIKRIFGADDAEYENTGTFPHVASITNGINSILINVSVIDGSVVGTNSGEAIWSFTPQGPPSSLLEVKPYFPTYVLCKPVDIVEEIRVRIVDQRGIPINLNGEPVTVSLHFMPV